MPPKKPSSYGASKSRIKPTSSKPLRDITNAVNTPFTKNPNAVNPPSSADNEPLDRLLLVHSDLSSLIHQIDELVVRSLQSPGEKDRKEIQEFADVLAEMQVSLKPYVKRFQETLSRSNKVPETNLRQSSPKKSDFAAIEDANTSICSPEETKWESLVSPSPLVSWRPNSNVDGSRHLFLLTPLPLPKSFTSKCQKSANSLFENSNIEAPVRPFSLLDVEENTEDILINDMTPQQTPRNVLNSNMTKTENNLRIQLASPSEYSMQRKSMLFTTPRLKTSPPKSCVLLEPIPEHHHKVVIRKSTPFPRKSTPFPRKNQNSHLSEDVESPTSSVHQPKEKPFTSVANECPLQQTALFTDQSTKLPPLNDIIGKGKDAVMVKSCKKDLGRPSEIIESTPLWTGRMSNLQSGKRPGENTLKRELWVKFEAATSQGCRLLDQLEEVSDDGRSAANYH